MKTRFFTILLILSMLVAKAQDFAPIGAVWHYSYQTIDPNVISFKKVESVSDTTINGIQCKKIRENTSNEAYYVYSKNDSVFVYKENSFHLLYNFGANSGETITLGNYYKTYNGLPLVMTIDSVKTILIAGQQRKVQFVTCGDGMVISFGGQVIQGIGNTNYMFPTLDFASEGPLRCYQEANSATFINPYYTEGNWNKTDCEQIIVINSSSETTNMSISFFPDSENNYLKTTGAEQHSAYKIFDTNGKIVLHGVINNLNTIDIQSLNKGIYLIEIKSSNSRSKYKFTRK